MSEVKRYSAQPFSPSGLMFENEFGHYILFCEYEKLKAELKQVIEIGVEGQREINRKAHAEITKLTRQRDTLKKCAEFYADQKQMNHGIEITYYETGFINEDDFEHIGQIKPGEYGEYEYYVYGKTARKALQEAEGME